MGDLEIQPFADEHLDAAGQLLAERHARHRAAEPLLPDEDARAAVEAAWRPEDANGVVAIRRGAVVGYLFGLLEGEQPFWGNLAWVDRASHAAGGAELMRDLYAAAAEVWVERGANRNYVLVPALDEDLDPWYRLGFAQMHVEAIGPSGAGPASLPDGVTIRRGGPKDLEDAIPIDRLIQEVQAVSPSFSFDASKEDRREAWIETLADPEVTHLIAERDGRVLGHATLFARPEFATPVDAIYLASTATVPEVRGSGVGLALTRHALRWAQEAGYPTVVTNWRVTNLLASRFWPARGFRPVFHRLHRAIGLG
jgi:GNAT superfamily N-acetyltransferase